MQAILDAYLLGLQESVTHLRPELKNASATELIDFFGAVLTFQHVVHQAIASSFFEHRESTVGETQAARGALLAALTEGGDATDAPSEPASSCPSSTSSRRWRSTRIRTSCNPASIT